MNATEWLERILWQRNFLIWIVENLHETADAETQEQFWNDWKRLAREIEEENTDHG